MAESIDFRSVFSQLQVGPLDGDSVERSFDAILAGAWTPVQVGGFLTALRIRGEDATTIAAAARAMRAAMRTVTTTADVILDTCGTGGDGSGSINLSTAAAIICAAAGITVAKHGNRAISSKSGSADVLEAMGIPIDLEPTASEALLRDVGIAFLLAPVHHPAMRHAMPVRRDLGVRTIFNCLGPLANPAGATHQLIGAFADELRPVLAGTLKELGTRRAWIVRGEDGLDEVSPYAPTRVTQLDSGEITERIVQPEDFGLAKSPPGAAAGADAKTNAETLEAILRGADHPARDAVILNAAAALVVAENMAPTRAAAAALDSLASGKAAGKLDQWRKAASALATR